MTHQSDASASETDRHTRTPGRIDVRPARTRQDCTEVGEVLNAVWMTLPSAPVFPDGVLLTFATTGLCVAGAYDGDVCIGAVVGFLGFEDGDLTARLDYMGVLDGRRDRGVADGLWGFFLTWARSTPAIRATWTFDPTVRRNAHLYLTKYGARVAAYKPDAYGTRDDGLNAGDPSDRLLAVVDFADAAPDSGTPSQWVDLPSDYAALDPHRALAARNTLRRQLSGAMNAGLSVVLFDQDRGYGLA
jgi:predicted GNAT superfamily acetyltransferase